MLDNLNSIYQYLLQVLAQKRYLAARINRNFRVAVAPPKL